MTNTKVSGGYGYVAGGGNTGPTVFWPLVDNSPAFLFRHQCRYDQRDRPTGS